MNEGDPTGKSFDPTIDREGGRQLKGKIVKRLINVLRLQKGPAIDVQTASPDKIDEAVQARKEFPLARGTLSGISKN